MDCFLADEHQGLMSKCLKKKSEQLTQTPCGDAVGRFHTFKVRLRVPPQPLWGVFCFS